MWVSAIPNYLKTAKQVYFKEERVFDMEKAFFYDTKIGRIMITEDNEGITGLSLVKQQEAADRQLLADYELYETGLIKAAAEQLMEYLGGSRSEFQIKLNPKGTLFQKKVWEALRTIPYGETRSYKQIAYAVGNEKASRAVGMANHNNPIMIFVPCHRVIGANGGLVGFGAGLDVKEQLLNLEKNNIHN